MADCPQNQILRSRSRFRCLRKVLVSNHWGLEAEKWSQDLS